MIRVAPSATSHRVSPGQGLAAEEITISSEGPGAVNYTIVATVPWLSVTPASGRNTGEVDHLALQYDAAGLAAGVHTGSVRVLDPAAANSPQTVKVTITVESRCDHDHDGDVDQSDFGYLQSCLTDGLGTPEPPCIDADLNGDNHVDLEDFDLLVECMGGPDSPIAVTCSR
jgi:hypothetical protein